MLASLLGTAAIATRWAERRSAFLLHDFQTRHGDSPWVKRTFPLGYCRRNVKLTTHLQPVPGQETVDLYVHYPIRLHGLILT